ncbi:TrkH family potassium uptake protein [Sulfurospirillum multivorans]|uniref:K+ Transporter family protein n=2 Tax=Sulfurospirillum multivorans TaxID=66821 RepID=A0AA86DYJ6_SULMK|nr:TrkH family potassium uptake protein [Sulfurospirillum multivorans]AHJ13343.1 K+ Transporter family protein [Sulfurospirillum multivorans DSM 12446]QEH06833.1 K+ Transporter family protein [Sulfurospirillum multivorans]
MNQKTLRIILFSYLAVIFCGAIVLMLPFAHVGKLAFIDALFTSTSATCVTGLIVKSTSEHFTFFGQCVILILMQVGGVGYMSIVTLFFLFMKKNLTIHEKNMAKDSLNYAHNLDIQSFLKKVFLFTFIIEGLGIGILTVRFGFDMSFKQALWQAIFHAVSAFNNAGFSLFTDSFISYNHDFTVIGTIGGLIICGGIGYLVLVELHAKAVHKRFMLSAHTKITLLGTVILLISGIILFLAIEWDTKGLFAHMSLYRKLLNSFFLSVNFRTSGFNSLDLSLLSDASLFCSTIYMMIGGGAGSTAGGIKITTVAVLIIATMHTMKISNQAPHAFKRTISQEIINRSSAIILVASFITITATIVLVETQHSNFMKTLFEVVSAFCTVGVSAGNGDILSLSDTFNPFGKSIIIALMLIGRMGIFAFGFLIIGREKIKHVQYPEGRILL